jgi:hypothetical protein
MRAMEQEVAHQKDREALFAMFNNRPQPELKKEGIHLSGIGGWG